MRIIYHPELKATVTLDDSNQIRSVNHLDEHRELEHLRGRDAAAAYVRNIAETLNLAPQALRAIEQPVSYVDPQPLEMEYRSSEEKASFDSATYAYCQTYLNTPVWAAGITTTVKHAPARIVATTNTSAHGVNAKLPSKEALDRYRRLFATGEKVDLPFSLRSSKKSNATDPPASDLLMNILDMPRKSSRAPASGRDVPELIRGRFFVYQYDPAKRGFEPPRQKASKRVQEGAEASLGETVPTLPMPPLPRSIQAKHWYLVAELLFRLPFAGARMNWRMLVDVETNAMLHLRALTSGVSGLVFTYDPITSTGAATNTPDRSNAILNPLRDDVVLANLNPPFAGIQLLEGRWATLADFTEPSILPPTHFTGERFDHDVHTDDFSAVNAYYHVDRFFRLVESLGFPLSGAGGYFGGTAFPVEVDHRGLGTGSFAVNAQCVGDGDGIDFALFGIAADTVDPVGIATDWRVVLHELGGHGTLEDNVGSPNFGFAHSAGDSFAMILNDYLSEWHSGGKIDRFVLAPFVPKITRRSDRAVTDGWGWGGPKDTGIHPESDNPGYQSEQILSTTMFRVYRTIGGDSTSVKRREFAARYMGYLMLNAIHRLTPMSNPESPAEFLAALIRADRDNWTSDGVAGGAYGKVLAWSFEKQDLNRGARPSVDVYIDDGRAGEYSFTPVHWTTAAIWNRRHPDGKFGHEEPALGATNYAYVKIKNRGTSVANNVTVRGYHCKPSAGVFWPNDLQPMTTPQLIAPPTDDCVKKRQKVADLNERVADLKGDMEGATGSVLHGLAGKLAQAQNQLASAKTALANCESRLHLATLDPNNNEEKTVGPFLWTPVTNGFGHDCMLMIVSAAGDPANVEYLSPGEVIEDWRLVPHDNNIGQHNTVLLPGAGGTSGLVAGLHGKAFWVGNPSRTAAVVAVSIVLPPLLVSRGWTVQTRDLAAEGGRLKPREERLVTFEVHPGGPFTSADVAAETVRDIVVTATADGAIIGGMVYRIDPDLERPFNEGRPEGIKKGCKEQAGKLLECLNMPGAKAKRVRISKVSLEIDMESEDNCD